MDPIGLIIRKLREENRVSQRRFADATGMSYRQVQRIEKGESDITMGKFLGILHTFDRDLKLIRREPDWNTLVDFGLPVRMGLGKRKKYDFPKVIDVLISSVFFLDENKQAFRHQRIFDAFISLLLTLKTHYPTIFRFLREQTGRDLDSVFELQSILGRHIKLRNISLLSVSKYLARERIDVPGIHGHDPLRDHHCRLLNSSQRHHG